MLNLKKLCDNLFVELQETNGGESMVNSDLLKAKIKESGIKISYVAIQIGLTPAGFYKKLNNESEFKVSEIIALTRVLNLSSDERDEIFFAHDVA